MKSITKLGIALAAFCAVIATGCGKDPITPTNEVINEKSQGKLKISLDKNDEYQIISKAAEPTLADMSVAIINKYNGQTVQSWPSYSDVPEEVILVSGNYTVSVQNRAVANAAFDAPRYAASQDFEVKIGETSSLNMIAMLTNVKVSINYAPSFLLLVTDVNTVVSNGAGVLEFGATETRPGYFAVPADGKLTVTVNCKRISDNQALQKVYIIDDVAARQWHKINIDVAISGKAVQGISINSLLVDKDHNLTIDGNGIISNNGDNGTWDEETDPVEPVDPVEGAPTIVGKSYNGDTFPIDQTLTVSASETEILDVEISAPTGGIRNLFVTIDSPVLSEPVLGAMGLWGTFDLANIEPGSIAEISLLELQLIDLENPVKNKLSHTFSIGTFMSLLGIYQVYDVEHKFTIEVVDGEGNRLTKTLTILLTE